MALVRYQVRHDAVRGLIRAVRSPFDRMKQTKVNAVKRNRPSMQPAK
jgi:hypothetical protein